MLNLIGGLFDTDRGWVAVAVAVAAALAAVVSAVIAIREAQARAKDARKYTGALEAVIDAGQYAIHLRGMEERMTSLNSRFEQLGAIIYNISEHMKTTAEASEKMIDLTTKHIQAAMANVEGATSSIHEISKSLTEIANAARRSQRESLRAHKELMKQLSPDEESEDKLTTA